MYYNSYYKTPEGFKVFDSQEKNKFIKLQQVGICSFQILIDIFSSNTFLNILISFHSPFYKRRVKCFVRGVDLKFSLLKEDNMQHMPSVRIQTKSKAPLNIHRSYNSDRNDHVESILGPVNFKQAADEPTCPVNLFGYRTDALRRQATPYRTLEGRESTPTLQRVRQCGITAMCKIFIYFTQLWLPRK